MTKMRFSWSSGDFLGPDIEAAVNPAAHFWHLGSYFLDQMWAILVEEGRRLYSTQVDPSDVLVDWTYTYVDTRRACSGRVVRAKILRCVERIRYIARQPFEFSLFLTLGPPKL